MATTFPSTEVMTNALTDQLAQNTKFHFNLDQNAIITTEDKLRLVLLTHLEHMEHRRSWMAPAGVFIAILTSVVTTNFKDLWLPAATWQAIFVLAGGACFVWLLVSLWAAYKAPSIEDVVSELKKSTQGRAEISLGG